MLHWHGSKALLGVCLAGTAAYMAPELLQKGKMTRAADVYSFAMIMVELFTCKRLFEGLAQQQVPPLHFTHLT